MVLLDMNLPVMDGWTVVHTLRGRSNRVPVIAWMAHAMAGNRARTLEAGCDDYHPKPVDFDRLLGQIDQNLLRAEGVGGWRTRCSGPRSPTRCMTRSTWASRWKRRLLRGLDDMALEQMPGQHWDPGPGLLFRTYRVTGSGSA